MKIQHQIGTFKSYLSGLVIAALLNFGAYFIVATDLLSGFTAYSAIGSLMLAQVMVLLILYLQLGREHKPRWNLALFFFMVLVLIILIVGSLWIMYHLDYNLMGMG